jgi:hypothetical protein
MPSFYYLPKKLTVEDIIHIEVTKSSRLCDKGKKIMTNKKIISYLSRLSHIYRESKEDLFHKYIHSMIKKRLVKFDDNTGHYIICRQKKTDICVSTDIVKSNFPDRETITYLCLLSNLNHKFSYTKEEIKRVCLASPVCLDMHQFFLRFDMIFRDMEDKGYLTQVYNSKCRYTIKREKSPRARKEESVILKKDPYSIFLSFPNIKRSLEMENTKEILPTNENPSKEQIEKCPLLREIFKDISKVS